MKKRSSIRSKAKRRMTLKVRKARKIRGVR